MSRSRGRAQVEPTAALAAVAALAVVFAAYGGSFADALPDSSSDDAPPALARTAGAVTAGGVVHPTALGELGGLDGAGRRVNVTLSANGQLWTAGPDTPSGGSERDPDVDVAARPVAVVARDGQVWPGRLRVVVW